MQPGKTLRARMGFTPIAALALACLMAPSPAIARVAAPAAEGLSPALARLSKPDVSTLPPVAQARVLGVAKQGPGSLVRQGERVLTEVRFEGDPAARLSALHGAGAAVVSVSPRYEAATVAVKPEDLRALAGVGGVESINEVRAPITFAAAGCPSGATVSEGDGQLHAAEARSRFGVDGSGVTVGILSDSFNRATSAADGSGAVATHAAEDVATGDLPGVGNPCGLTAPVNVLDDSESKGEDEGRAMTQIVHDLAPGAKLAFATAFTGETGFARNIEKLAAPVGQGGAGARVIADDVAYFEEPFFQDGPIAVAASKVSAAGVDYFSAAGNDNLFDGAGHEIASWEAPEFRDSQSCPTALTVISALAATHCMDFNPGSATDNTFGIRVEEGATLTVDLQWAEPWYGVRTDLDAFLLDSTGTPIKVGGSRVESAEDNVGKTKKPVEIIQWENSGPEQEVQLAVNRCSGSCNEAASATATPRLKITLLENGRGVTSTEYPVSSGGDMVGPTIFGHAGAAAVMSVGAVPFDNSFEPERYSSRGPVAHYYGPVSGTTPAPKLPAAEVISKPDIAATDCGVTTFFAYHEGSTWRFCGTSAAAPHAAAVAALLLQRNALLSPLGVRSVLRSTASPVGTYGENAVGAGLVNAVSALEDVGPATAAAVEEGAQAGRTASEEVAGTASTAGTSSAPSTPGALRVFFIRHPRKVVRTRGRSAKVRFRFGSNVSGATFICSVDRHRFHGCGESLSRSFPIGRYVLRIGLRMPSGAVAPVTAGYRFRVEPYGT